MPSCLVAECRAAAAQGALVQLCVQHLALAAESSVVDDLLPSPCPVCGSRTGIRYPSGWLCAICEWAHGTVPDGELRPARLDVVYYLQFESRIKIGTTGNLRQRLRAIWHDELVAIELGDRRLEQRRHEQFAAARLERTEWFDATPELRAHVAAVAGGADPAVSYARWQSEALAARAC